MGDERFQIVREIARGGMGRVVEALDLELGRTVALKQALDDDPEARGRFTREVEITARLEHPSIVPVYDAGVTGDGAPFYVMRLVSGAPLDRLVADAATLDDRLGLLPNLLAVADAVAHAHGRGVIHRDLKPSNVLVGELGETVVIDWGLAKIVGEAEPTAGGARPVAPARPLETTVGTVIGTPGFMAPEQVTGGAADARSDVYALGACLYTVLAGRPPLAGVAEAELLSRTADGAVPPITAIAPGVPADLASIVDTAMARDPARRYLDAGGLSEDLRRFLTGRLVASHHYGTGQRLVRWVRRHRVAVAVGAIAIAILIAVGVYSIHRIVAAGDRTRAALARERDRADDLVVTQAIGLLDADPTMAIATLQQLRPDSPRWAGLGPIVAAARARGIVVGYPGHGPADVRVAFAPDPDDARVLTTGGGVVRLHDLAARTSTVLVEAQRVFAEWAGPLVVITGDPLPHSPYLLDPRTRAEATIPWPAEIVYSHGAGGLVVFVDAAGAIGALDVSRGLPLAAAPVTVALDIPATFAWASPSARWLIAGNAQRLELLRRNAPDQLAWTRVRDLPGDAFPFAWTADESRVAFGSGGATIAIELATGAETRWAGVSGTEHVFAGDRLFAVDLATEEIRELDRDGTARRMIHFDTTTGHSLAAAGDAAVMIEGPRSIAVVRGAARHALHPPVDVVGIAARPAGRYVIGVNAANLVVWDLDDILPERAPVPTAAKLGYTRDGDVIAIGALGAGPPERPIYRYALADRPFAVTATRIGKVPLDAAPFFALDGVVVAFDAEGTVHPVAPPVPSAITGISEIATDDRGATLIGTTAGAIHMATRDPDADRVIATLPARITGIAARGGWLAAVAADGTLWRRSPDGSETTARDAAAGHGGIAVTATGDVIAGTTDHVIDWPIDAAPIATVPLAQPALGVVAITGERIAVMTDDGVVLTYDPVTRTAHPILPAATAVVYSRDRRRAAALVGGAVVVVELATGARWTALDRIDVDSGWLALSPDGDTLLAGETTFGTAPAIDRWHLAVPADLRAWTAAATNAQPPAGERGVVDWQPLPSLRPP